MSMKDFILTMSIRQPNDQKFMGKSTLILVYKTLILA